VASRVKAKLLSDPLLHFIQFGRKKLHRVAAERTHHVVMRSPVQPVLIARHAILEVNFESKPALSKEFKSAIDRCVANARIPLLYEPM